MRTMRIAAGPQGSTLAEAVVRFVHGHGGLPDGGSGFAFDDARYLEAKNTLDARAINADCAAALQAELARQLQGKSSAAVLDLGAGSLSMLPRLLGALRVSMPGPGASVTYVAFESNPDLLPAIRARLRGLGLEEADASASASATPGPRMLTFRGGNPNPNPNRMLTFRGDAQGLGLDLVVHVVAADFMTHAAGEGRAGD